MTNCEQKITSENCEILDENRIFWGINKWKINHWHFISPSETQTVLFHLPLSTNQDQPPKPQKGQNKWDTDHVRLPSSIHNQYPVIKPNGKTVIEKRWELIQNALLQPILTSRDLEKAILSYNTKYEKLWKFTTLHRLFEEEVGISESLTFFDRTLPKIISLALQLPDLVPNAIPLLKQGQNRSISLSQQQISCLLANAFLCTFPRRNTRKKNSEYSSFPDINFNRLFQSPDDKVAEKLKCICNYFRRVCDTPPTGVLTFVRRSVSENLFPNWIDCDLKFSKIPIHVSADGTIEENGLGMLQVDFANKFIGGGVLRGGAVQEEIRFVICPELIVSRLFIEYLKPNEAIIIIGCEQFNKYSGYASTFTWNGNYNDDTPLDSSGRRRTHIVAIDALRFIHTHHQFKEELMLRELKKAYTGFLHSLKTPAPPIASGNWGCGAFKGSTHLKSLLQLMVCVVTGRPLVYFTFGDEDLCDSINEMYKFLCDQNITVGELWKYLKLFAKEEIPSNLLYKFIYQQKHKNMESIRKSLTTTNHLIKPAVDKPKTSDSIIEIENDLNNTPVELSSDVEMSELPDQKTLNRNSLTSKEKLENQIALNNLEQIYIDSQELVDETMDKKSEGKLKRPSLLQTVQSNIRSDSIEIPTNSFYSNNCDSIPASPNQKTNRKYSNNDCSTSSTAKTEKKVRQKNLLDFFSKNK